ncbi:MAG: MFS transporter [Candidatus Promineifilaceae bacterium]|nr:MFS transporter [Candidatus Promineifilaceae bacterium]
MMRYSEKNQRLTYLFLSNFSIYFTGMGLFPLLPLYATEFGATSAMVGIYLAVTYVAITAGTLLTGRLVQRLTPRGLFLFSGGLGALALVFLGQANALWHLFILTAVIWFTGGSGLALVSILTGLVADKNSRGKSFGLMFMTRPVASLSGGLIISWLLSDYSYSLMLMALAAVWAILPVVGLLSLRHWQPDELARNSEQQPQQPAPLGWTFYLLLVVVLLSTLALYGSRMTMSLSMQSLSFTASDVASTATVSGLFGLPIVPLGGALSDRLGRKRMLIVTVVAGALGTLALTTAAQLWHFWLATSMMLFAQSVGLTVASALATDLLSARALQRGLPWLNGAGWMAGIVGFAGAGYVLEALGPQLLYLGAAGLAGLAALLVLAIRPQTAPENPLAAAARLLMVKLSEQARIAARPTPLLSRRPAKAAC